MHGEIKAGTMAAAVFGHPLVCHRRPRRDRRHRVRLSLRRRRLASREPLGLGRGRRGDPRDPGFRGGLHRPPRPVREHWCMTWPISPSSPPGEIRCWPRATGASHRRIRRQAHHLRERRRDGCRARGSQPADRRGDRPHLGRLHPILERALRRRTTSRTATSSASPRPRGHRLWRTADRRQHRRNRRLLLGRGRSRRALHHRRVPSAEGQRRNSRRRRASGVGQHGKGSHHPGRRALPHLRRARDGHERRH